MDTSRVCKMANTTREKGFRDAMLQCGWRPNGKDKKGRDTWKHEKTGAVWFEDHFNKPFVEHGIVALEIPF